MNLKQKALILQHVSYISYQALTGTALFRLHTAIFCESIFLLFFWSMYVLIYFCNKGSSLHIRLKNLLNILDERLPERRLFKQVVYKMFTYLVISIARPCTILKENSSVHSG